MAFTILGKSIGAASPCYIIAEAGLNHNGDVTLAKRLIDMAVVSGCDAVKFQKRTVDSLAVQSVLDAPDDRFPEFGDTYRKIREHLEFNFEQYSELMEYCDEREMTFLCTAFDTDAADFLERIGVPAYKVASHSVTNLPLLDYIAELGKPTIMSTGMCTLEELDLAVGIFLKYNCPISLMHCVSSYPQPFKESNLSMIGILKQRYKVPVGYSGHEIGYLPTLAAVAMGVDMVERHITMDNNMIGFDHKISLEPAALANMVRDIRAIGTMSGNGEKCVSDTEMITRKKYHVSIVAREDIKLGEVLKANMLTFKNPGTGLQPRQLVQILGRKAKIDIPADTLIRLDMLEEQKE
jgi:sialic acid synthase SpsE